MTDSPDTGGQAPFGREMWEEPSKAATPKRSAAHLVLVVMLIILVVMMAYQMAKHYFLPGIAFWKYDAHANIFSALVAAVAAFFVLRNRRLLLHRIAGQVHELRAKEEELERHRRNLEALVEARTAELKAANDLLQTQILQRERVEAALRESETGFRAIADTSPAGIFIVQDGTFKYSNNSMSAITGFSAVELRSMSFWDAVHPDFRDTVRERGVARLAGQDVQERYEVKIVTKRGEERWLELAVAVLNYKERPVILGTVVDVTDRKEAEAILKESEERYRAAIEYSNDGVALVKDGKYILVNRKLTEIFGYESTDEIVGAPVTKIVHPDDCSRVLDIDAGRRGEAGAPERYEFKGLRRDGGVVYIEVSANAVPYRAEKVTLLYLRDITARKQWEGSLHESEEKYRSLFEESRDAIYIAASDGRYLEGNQAFLDLFGYTREEMMATNAKDVYASPQDRERFRKIIKEKKSVRDFDIKLRKKNGTVMDCVLTVTTKMDEKGKPVAYQGIVRDITDRKRAEEAVRHMAYHDALTGLPNRMLFNDRLNMAMIRARRSKQRVGVVMLDLDKFKEVNDTLGHVVGDELLKVASTRLKKLLRKSDTIARMGGDEFLLVLPDINQIDDVHQLVRKIVGAFQTPFKVDEYDIAITTSAGIALYPEDGTDTNTLIKNADIAMYRAKQLGRNMYQRFGAMERSKAKESP